VNPSIASSQTVAVVDPPTSNLRAALRLIGLLSMVVLWWVVCPIPLFIARCFGYKAHRRTGALIFHHFHATMLKILGGRLHVTGTPPAPGSMALSNHQSYFDILALSAAYPLHFVAKSDIATWPIVGWGAVLGGTIFFKRFDRKDIRRVNASVDKLLNVGVPVAIFPEGTNSPGDRVMKFNAPLLDAAIDGNRVVTPAAIHYHRPGDPIGAPNPVAWYGTKSLVGHMLGFLGQPGVDIHLKWLEPSRVNSEMNRKELARNLRTQVINAYAELSGIPAQQLEETGNKPPDFHPEIAKSAAYNHS